MKRFVLVLLTLILLFSVACADEFMYVLCKPDDYVNARFMPSTKSQAVGRLECGDEVELVGETQRDLWF